MRLLLILLFLTQTAYAQRDHTLYNDYTFHSATFNRVLNPIDQNTFYLYKNLNLNETMYCIDLIVKIDDQFDYLQHNQTQKISIDLKEYNFKLLNFNQSLEDYQIKCLNFKSDVVNESFFELQKNLKFKSFYFGKCPPTTYCLFTNLNIDKKPYLLDRFNLEIKKPSFKINNYCKKYYNDNSSITICD